MEVAFAKSKTAEKKNPIATLRRSIGGRLPEEYFAELLAGWSVEDLIMSEIENKGLNTSLTGADRGRKVLFVRPNKMGDYDLKVEIGAKSYLLEIQRVGKLTITQKKFLKTALKHHKYEGGSSNDKVLVLWIGKDPTQISKKHEKLFNHLVFIANARNRGNKEVQFTNDTIFIAKSLVEKSTLSWDDLKKYNKAELVGFLKKLTIIP